MPTDRSASVFLSSVVVFAIIGCLAVVYVALRPLLDAALHAFSVLPK